MVDLGRLVMRSKARGLKTRLAAALGLVLLGKWTGVIGPLMIQGAIDHLNKGRSAPWRGGMSHRLRRPGSRLGGAEVYRRDRALYP